MSMGIKRCIIVILGLLLQISLFLFAYLYLGEIAPFFKVIYRLFGLFIVLWIIKNSQNLSYDLPWLVIILIFPLVGTLLYLIIGHNKLTSRTLKAIRASEKNLKKYFVQNPKVRATLDKNNSQIRYITDYLHYPVTTDNDVKYYPVGELAFAAMKRELKKAEDFIFFEYFIVEPGKMWDEILTILKEKAAAGVEVRVMYDDLGCVNRLAPSYPKELAKSGIKCVAFNKLSPLSGIIMNNRDHRKMLIIDGKVVFSGGINISDEYINLTHPLGHWKDNGIKITGSAVWNFTVMFLTMWNACEKTDKNFTKYQRTFKSPEMSKGYVIPYGESPLDHENAGQNIYLNIINQSNNYVYIFTPYLIIDNEMLNSLILAAKRGVDVRIVIPGVPDKKIVYALTESYAEPLVKAGVKVYKYTPGFVHSKVFASDDRVATVGTLNLDYRSLYLHFECGVYLEDTKSVKDVKKDLVETITKSKLLSARAIKPTLLKGAFQAVLRLIAPLT